MPRSWPFGAAAALARISLKRRCRRCNPMGKVQAIFAMGALVLPIALAQPAFSADANKPAPAREKQALDADNTGRNARDADGGTLTPLDQGESEADRTITQQIRKAVVN